MKQWFSLYRLDPRTKMLFLVCLSSMAMLTDNVFYLLVMMLFTLFLLLVGGVSMGNILQRAKPLVVVIFSLFVIQSLFARAGESLLAVHGFGLLFTGGLMLGGVLVVRLIILVLSALLMLTGEARDYLLALVQLKVPYEIAFMVMAAIHFIPILREEALKVFYAVQLRGTELTKILLRQKPKLYLRICLPILACALERTKAMAIAMEARAFRVYPQRTYLRKLVLHKRDKLLLLMAVLSPGLILLMKL